jgi:manganese/iron transport system permease protein
MTGLFAILTEPFVHGFMQRGLVVAILVGAICAMLSCYLVLKGWSLMGDAVSHAVLPGIVVAHVLSVPLVLGAFVAGLLCAVTIGYLKHNSRVREDAVMGVIFSGMFALGLVMMLKVNTEVHLNHVLFGNMLGVTWLDVVETALIAVPAVAIVLARRRDLLLYCFDEAHARAIGLSVKSLYYGLLIVLSLTIVVSLKAVGIVLVVAMLIAPGAIGFLLTRQFERMMAVAVIAAVASCTLGTIASFHLDVATGPCIVVIQAAVFCTALAWRLLRHNAAYQATLNLR